MSAATDARWLVVTPARNEADRLPDLAISMQAQRVQPTVLWVIVDDGSTDDTAHCLDGIHLDFPTLVICKEGGGGLRGGSAFASFFVGADAGLARLGQVDRVMKLDADFVLHPDYFAHLVGVPPTIGCTGGMMDARRLEREQSHYVLGALKAYTPEAYAVVRRLPAAVGLDVVDEIALRMVGLDSRVVPAASATTTRRIGSSEGLLRGRVRNGTVSRWTGYHPVYFSLRFARYAFRRPYGIGALALLWGYISGGTGPYPPEIRRAFRDHQRRKLQALARHPVRWIRQTYSIAGELPSRDRSPPAP